MYTKKYIYASYILYTLVILYIFIYPFQIKKTLSNTTLYIMRKYFFFFSFFYILSSLSLSLFQVNDSHHLKVNTHYLFHRRKIQVDLTYHLLLENIVQKVNFQIDHHQLLNNLFASLIF